MASLKKRKAEQDIDTKPLHPAAVEYIRQPDSDAAASDSEADYEEAEEEEDVRKLLEPLSIDQLSSLLVSAADRDPSTLAEIRALADADPSHRKLFVHGLDWNTTSDGLRAAFSRYGEIVESRVVFDRPTGRSKGYGFILFRHRSSARRALRKPQKLIENRMASCQLASNGPTPNPNATNSHNPNPSHSSGDNLSRKIYVGNVHSDIDGRRLHAFFSQYGEIEEGPLGFDRHTGKSKGFAIFLYKSSEGARKALEEGSKNFEGHHLVCQKATDGQKGRASAPVSSNAGGGSMAAAPNVPASYAGYNGSAYGGQVAQSDMGLAQQAAMLGQGLLGQAMPANAAVLAMLAATGQNPAAFGITPAMLASLNPALAVALAAGAAPAALPQAASAVTQQQGTVPMQGYGMGSSGYQNIGFQGAPGFQGPPGFQSVPGFQGNAPQVGTHQGGNTGLAAVQRSSLGSMSGYGLH